MVDTATFGSCSPEYLESLRVELDRLGAILRDNQPANAGNPVLARIILAHRMLTDLLALEGGTPEQRAAVMRKVNE